MKNNINNFKDDKNYDDITININFLELIIINLFDCFYSSIEIKNNYLQISNSNNKEQSRIQNPFPKIIINKNDTQNLLIYLLTNFIKQNLRILKQNSIRTKTIENKIALFEILSNQTIDFLQKTPNDLIIIYLPNSVQINYCKNIKKFIEKEMSFRLNNVKNSKIYYRGNKLNYNLSASLYRNKEFPRIEHIVNNRCIQSMPNDFNQCDSFFDKLTILKHFNCPSRLLDITENPLIASFFALHDYKTNSSVNYGAINLCFSSERNIIKNSHNSDSVSLISALSTTNKNLLSYSVIIPNLLTELDRLLENKINNNLNFYFFNELDSLFNQIDNLKSLIETTLNIIDNELSGKAYTLLKLFLFKISEIKSLKEEETDKFNALIKNIDKEIKILQKILKNDEIIKKYFFEGELQHQATLMNDSFNFYIPKKEDINSYYIVHPSLNNKRIINQQGLFIIIGATFDKDKQYLKPNLGYLKLFEYNKKRVVFIINNKSNKFFHELENTYGIKKGFIYPEMENEINQIKDDVMFEYGIEKN